MEGELRAGVFFSSARERPSTTILRRRRALSLTARRINSVHRFFPHLRISLYPQYNHLPGSDGNKVDDGEIERVVVESLSLERGRG